MWKELPIKAKLLIYGIIALIALIIILAINPFVTVGASERGLLLNWGAVEDKVLEPGLHFRMPIKQQIKTVSIQPIQLDHKVSVGSDGSVTKDLQTVGADMTIFYKYKPDQIVKMYKEYGEDKTKAIITQSLREAFKAEIGNYNIFQLPTVQDEIRGKVWEKLTERMADYPVELTELKITNFDWSDAFDAQIAETMSKAQQVKGKEQELLIAEQEAQKQVKQAAAEKTATVTKAEGARDAAKLHAEAKALEGEGIKKYNLSIAESMDQEIKFRQLEIERIKWEKWNGQQVSSVHYGPIPVQTGTGIGVK